MNEKINKLEEIVNILTNKESNVYFFTLDTKNSPSGEVKYTYDLALSLFEMGYNVTMLHQEDEFVGANEWLGDRYDVLVHKNVKEENITITPSDFLFIPEVLVNVMTQTKTLPCKRIMIYYNPSYFMDYMPVGMTLSDLNIYDVITTNENLQEKIKSYFPNINVQIVRPVIQEFFENDDAPKKLIVNVITSNSNEVNDIIKPFYWKNPIYKWLSFRDLKGAPQRVLGDMMKEAAITVCVDDNTNNAQMALEALKSGSILIAKVPQTTPEWMMDEDDWRFGIIWVDSYEMLHNTIASVVRGWTRNNILDQYLNMSDVVKNVFTKSTQVADIEKSIVKGVFDATLNTYKQILSAEKNNELKIEE